MRKFHLSDVLTVTTGKLLSSRHMDGVYDILKYMTDDDVYTHQIPRILNECAPIIIEQYPNLKNINLPEGVDIHQWLDEQINKFGEELEIKKLPKGYHAIKDPIAEMIEMRER